MQTKSPDSCRYDIISLGEVMLRLDPGEGRIHTTRTFRVWEGGGEYNVARGLRRCFGKRAAVVTAFADNPVGRLVEDFILQGGVDASLIKWVPYDGIGRSVRNGLNFTERGLGARWLHTGGIFAALSDTTPGVVIEALKAAKKYGTMTSYDLNYRPSLWKGIGGKERAQEVNKEIAKYVDVMIGNEEDFTACLGFEVAGADEKLTTLPVEGFKKMIAQVVAKYPNFKAVATTLRTVKTATVNDWGAILWHGGEFYQAVQRNGLEILDRVGGGDSFASGLIYGLMEKDDPALAVNYGAAHGALAMTTPGDTSMATLKEVEKLVGGAGARVDR